jgi:hypothetical protein
MEYKIGRRVRIRQFDDIHESIRHKGLGRNAGKEGEIVDILYSDANECYVYRIHFDGCATESRTDYLVGMFDVIEDEVTETYTHEIEYLDNVVVVRFYKVTDDSKQELARGHGHIIHDGAIGIAQATSYAMKRVYEKMNGGNF